MIQKIESLFIVSDSGFITNMNMQKLDSQLGKLAPGKYRITIELDDPEVEKLKKFYFVMESALAKHLGMSKVDLHNTLKLHIGQVISTKDKVVYESISKVKTTERMMERIVELQAFASEHFDYVTEPYREDLNDTSRGI